MPDQTIWDVFIQQIKISLIILARPVVQHQVVILIGILLLSWFGPVLIRAWVSRHRLRFLSKFRETDGPTRWRRYALVLFQVSRPLLGLGLNLLAIVVLDFLGHPSGLLQQMYALFIIWLIYQGVVSFLLAIFGEETYGYNRWVLAPAFILVLFLVLLTNLTGLQTLSEIPFFEIFGASITLRSVILALIIFYFFIIVAWLIEASLRRSFIPQVTVEPGLIKSITNIGRYVIIGLGGVIALGSMGLDFTTLAVIGGGLSIGIGFGLQQIIANFISGLVLLFEQSLKPGDVIDINGQIGTVERVSIRSSTIRTLNNVEVIVPNETFLTSQVTTFTKTSQVIRLLIPVGVSYSSDPRVVREVLLKTVARHGLVLSDPPPDLLFRGFGDSSLDFDLAVWIDQPERQIRVTSDLYYMIWTAFADQGIEIPFPQRDLNLRRG